jgi:hypothetical protein
MMKFTFDDIKPLLKDMPQTDNAILVCGQACNFWAEIYLRNKEYASFFPATSSDVDFLSNRSFVMSYTKHFNLKYEESEKFSDPVLLGRAKIKISGNKYIPIDFLFTVHALDSKKIKQNSKKMMVNNYQIAIMHPCHCLTSRVENVLTFKDDYLPHRLKQLKMMMAVMRERINILCQNEKRKALHEIEYIFNIRSRTSGRKIFKHYGIELFTIIPCDTRLGEDFIKKRYPQMKRKIKHLNLQDHVEFP